MNSDWSSKETNVGISNKEMVPPWSFREGSYSLSLSRSRLSWGGGSGTICVAVRMVILYVFMGFWLMMDGVA